MSEDIQTTYEIFSQNARQRGDELAAISPDKSLTHSEVLDHVDRLAAGLSKTGLERGDRICVLAQNSLEYLECYGACAKIGMIATPINWRLSAEEVGTVLSLAEPSCLIVGAEHVAQLDGLELGSIDSKFVIGDA